MDSLINLLGPVLGSIAALVIAIAVGLTLHWLLFRIVRRLTTDVPEVLFFQGALLRRIRRPLALLLPLIVIRLWLPLVAGELDPQVIYFISDLLYIGAVIAVAWLLVGGVRAAEDILIERSDLEAEDNLHARKMVTQAKILKRVIIVLIGLLTLAAILMHYEAFRELGTGLLASAGVAGLVIGLAAQRTLSNLLAGIQIAVTQPIRVDDVVIVEGEFGWVEEITLTYVVVRVWDRRRIVVPIADFIEKPFQNWTRTSSDLLGTVFLYVDYTVPVEALREEHQRVLEGSEEWDEEAAAVQVTDATDRAVQVRLLQSASSAAKLFALRCKVREAMIAFVGREYPGALPKTRAELHENGASASSASASGARSSGARSSASTSGEPSDVAKS